MKHILVIAVTVFMLVPAAAMADSAFVNDIMEITMRLGPGVDFRVIRTLSSGNEVKVLGTRKGWARVRTKDGVTGWVVARYLTGTEPASRIAKQATIRADEISAKLDALLSENKRLAEEKKELEQRLADTSASLEQATKNLSALREDSKGFLNLRGAYKKCATTLEKRNRRVASLEKDARARRMTAGIKWFLAGAGVLLIGVFIGLSSRRKRYALR